MPGEECVLCALLCCVCFLYSRGLCSVKCLLPLLPSNLHSFDPVDRLRAHTNEPERERECEQRNDEDVVDDQLELKIMMRNIWNWYHTENCGHTHRTKKKKRNVCAECCLRVWFLTFDLRRVLEHKKNIIISRIRRVVDYSPKCNAFFSFWHSPIYRVNRARNMCISLSKKRNTHNAKQKPLIYSLSLGSGTKRVSLCSDTAFVCALFFS